MRQCPLNQLANPADCRACVAANGRWSGDLHRLERALADVPGYQERLLWAMREAEAVLVVNPLTEELLKPFARNVRVVTAGMDAARFESGEGRGVRGERKRILFAGVVQEPSKGFHILEQACALLWQKRRDFELVATAEPAGQVGPFTRFLGWLSQEQLPGALFQADMVVLPAIGQEALGRTAVEAMAAGRPVVASRIGGLPVTVADGVTGLLCEPGDAVDLAAKIERLLDDAGLRERLGKAGRKRFEEEYSWDVIIERHYRPLLTRTTPRQKMAGKNQPAARRLGLDGRLYSHTFSWVKGSRVVARPSATETCKARGLYPRGFLGWVKPWFKQTGKLHVHQRGDHVNSACGSDL